MSRRGLSVRTMGMGIGLSLTSCVLACSAPLDGDNGSILEAPEAPGEPPGSDNPETATAQPTADVVPQAHRIARLTHPQWENTVRDLLRLQMPSRLSRTFAADTSEGTFQNDALSLKVTPDLREDYDHAASLLAQQVTADAALLAALLPPDLAPSGPERVRGFVAGFGLRALRRPLSNAEVERYVELFALGAEVYSSGDAFRDGVRLVIEGLLQSPHFLYRTELSNTELSNAQGVARLSQFEIASKLSFALINSMPDDQLFAAAESNALTSREQIQAQALRLLQSEAGHQMVADFHAQLLNLESYRFVDKDKARFPLWRDGLQDTLQRETLRFVDNIVFDQSAGLTELLLTPSTFVNQATAEIYGVAGAFDQELTKVDLDPDQRAGLLTQLGFLALNADRDRVNTIHRSVFVHRRILCTSLPPPVDERSITPPVIMSDATNRENVEAHTRVCGIGCHANLINPVGFAFEHYDAIGRYRTEDNAKPVNATDSFSFDGAGPQEFNGAVEFSRLVAQSRSSHDCYASHWLEYLSGRVPEPSDDNLIGRVGSASHDRRASVTDVVLELVTSEAFLSRPSTGAAQ